MTKPTRCTVAAVIRRTTDDPVFLAVRRPDDDESLPGAWGLPAVTLAPGELPEAALRRLGREKLGALLEPTRFIGIAAADRGVYELILMDIEAVFAGPEPNCRAANTDATRYVAQQWTSDLELLRPAASSGSLCCQILLERSPS
jgi:hypothetical protein